ncbi:ParA family protein [Paraburkholderia unamae]|uniref:ParA family protein n=1 Tax=Paraburkholderia unamae TaxID=219649 RepID=A0ACC6RWV1_9BURK
MPTIAIVNQKGGSAKTTVSSHIIHAATRRNLRTLAIDFDKQASLTRFFGVEATPGHATASQCFETALTGEVVRCTENLALLPADRALRLCSGAGAEAALQAAANVRTLATQHELVVIDTAGALGEDATTYAALLAADFVLAPFAVGAFEAHALADLWECLSAVRNKENTGLRVMGLLPSKVNTRSTAELAGLASLRAEMGDIIAPHVLAERASVKQAIAQGHPVWHATKGEGHATAAREWRAACNWVLDTAMEA